MSVLSFSTFFINYNEDKTSADKIVVDRCAGGGFTIIFMPNGSDKGQVLRGNTEFVKTYIQTVLEMLEVDDDRTSACSIDVMIYGFPTIGLLRKNFTVTQNLIMRTLALWLDQNA
jgi:hypothetical protein